MLSVANIERFCRAVVVFNLYLHISDITDIARIVLIIWLQILHVLKIFMFLQILYIFKVYFLTKYSHFITSLKDLFPFPRLSYVKESVFMLDIMINFFSKYFFGLNFTKCAMCFGHVTYETNFIKFTQKLTSI